VSDIDIGELAKRLHRLDIEQLGGATGTEYCVRAWAFVLRQLSPEELSTFAENPGIIFEIHEGNPIWDKVMANLNFWEEWSYGELLDGVAASCDDKHALSSVQVWEVLLGRMKFTREDYEFMIALLARHDDELCYDFFQGVDHELKDHDRLTEYLAIKPGYDPCDLHQRLDQAYSLMETDGTLERDIDQEF